MVPTSSQRAGVAVVVREIAAATQPAPVSMPAVSQQWEVLDAA